MLQDRLGEIKLKPIKNNLIDLIQPPEKYSSNLVWLLNAEESAVEPIPDKLGKIRRVAKEKEVPVDSVLIVTALDDIACFCLIRAM